MIDAAFVLRRAAFLADHYDRAAEGEVRFNLTAGFHLCGLIERAASVPRSGATRRRSLGAEVIQEAKAAFCRTHKVVHPAAWELRRRSTGEVRQALLLAAEHG